MTNKKLIISYRENDSHANFIPLIQSIVEKMNEDIALTFVEYPKEQSQEDVKRDVTVLYPSLDDGVIYLSDYTSSIPYEARKQNPDKEISKENLEELYRRVFGLTGSVITDYEECKGKSEIEIRQFADKDIIILAKEIANKVNDLDVIEKVSLVTDCLSHHISSLARLRNMLKENEGVTYDDHRERYYQIDKEIHDEYGKKLFDQLKDACPNKEVMLNDMIDMTWKRLDIDRREYLRSIDVENVCLINDGHNRLGNPNYGTAFKFSNALTMSPSEATIGGDLELENRKKWEKRLLAIGRFPQVHLEEGFTKELMIMLSKNSSDE